MWKIHRSVEGGEGSGGSRHSYQFPTPERDLTTLMCAVLLRLTPRYIATSLPATVRRTSRLSMIRGYSSSLTGTASAGLPAGTIAKPPSAAGDVPEKNIYGGAEADRSRRRVGGRGGEGAEGGGGAGGGGGGGGWRAERRWTGGGRGSGKRDRGKDVERGGGGEYGGGGGPGADRGR